MFYYLVEMLKIQYGIAGFFTGAFIGFLFGLIEMRLIDHSKHSAMLFFTISLTVIICGIIGLRKGLKMARRIENES